MFDCAQVAKDHRGPAADRLLVARLSSIAQRYARWGDLAEDEKAAGAAELREIAGDRSDLLAEAAGTRLGWSEGKRPEHEAQAQAVAEHPGRCHCHLRPRQTFHA